MNATPLLFEAPDLVVSRPARAVAHPLVSASEDSVTGVAGVALWGELLDRLGLVAEADRRCLRPIAPGGYTGGECYRAIVETQLAGGDFLADRALLADEATQALVGRTEGAFICPEGAACFAAAARLRRQGWIGESDPDIATR